MFALLGEVAVKRNEFNSTNMIKYAYMFSLIIKNECLLLKTESRIRIFRPQLFSLSSDGKLQNCKTRKLTYNFSGICKIRGYWNTQDSILLWR